MSAAPARRQLARIALAIVIGAGAVSIWLIVAALFSTDFASDFENGTHTYRGGAALPCLASAGVLALLVGCFGSGRAAVCCRVLAGLGGALILILVLAARR